jgi:hypothetical protein
MAATAAMVKQQITKAAEAAEVTQPMAQMLPARLAETVARAATCQLLEAKRQAPRFTQVAAAVAARQVVLVVLAAAAIVVPLVQLIQVAAVAARRQQVAQAQQAARELFS